MSNRSRLSRGDRRRNDRLGRLRAVVSRETAVLAFDLAADKQVCALTDQDSRVLARRTVAAKAWQLTEVVRWGLDRAGAAGFSSVVVACEPTGHRWRVLDQIAEEAGVRLVCVQPLLVHRARESEDFTRNKSDETDAMIIARLVTELRCYLPERADPEWARLRHLGARRAALITDATAARLQILDLLECAWPAALEASGKPMRSKSWLAAMTVALDRVGTGGDLSVIRRWGWTRFAAAVRREIPRHGAARWYSAIVRGVFDAAADPARAGAGVADQRAGAMERVRFALADLAHARAEIAVVEARMVEVLDDLGLTDLVTSIPGLSAVGAAAILAETGDPTRFSSARALVKHAGLCPRDNASGAFQGKTGISGRGRPQLRLAAWRAVWAALRNNPVLATRYAHLTGRADNKLTKTQARVAVSGSLLRQLHAVITTGTAWDPAIASGLTPQSRVDAKAAAAAA
ncbi:IS110 family transposase [Pimelobacter simplex]|uniref:IS110 family transposase n=1 Tax=Nocardioides simplex TaxID=2045 RepID=UPI0021505BC0|nr:IS110 family transposase [Pimelobacter simplex]UUW92558.1 IS110 family transposase [Pimelobacter simplex]UUW96385.1 IS110 family transposase [Pimelobacter simplex]